MALRAILFTPNYLSATVIFPRGCLWHERQKGVRYHLIILITCYLQKDVFKTKQREVEIPTPQTPLLKANRSPFTALYIFTSSKIEDVFLI